MSKPSQPYLGRASAENDDGGTPSTGDGAEGKQTPKSGSAQRIRELEDRVALLESILDGLPDAVFAKDGAHRYVYANPRLGQLLQRDNTVMFGRSDLDFLPPGQVRAVWERDDAALEQGALDSLLEELEDANGEKRLVTTRRACITGPNGRTYIVGSVRDLTEADRRQVELERELARIRDLLDQAAQQGRIGVVLLDRNGNFALASGPELARMGINTRKVSGVDYRSLGALWPEVIPLVATALGGRAVSKTLNWRGRARHVTINPLYDDDGQLDGASLFSIDLSELGDRDRRLAQAERMNSLGRLAGGVAHDLNNLLSIIMMGASSLREAASTGDLSDLDTQVRILERSVDRGSRLSRQLAAFARRQVGPPAVVDLHAHLRPTRSFLDSLVGPEVSLDFRLCPGAPRVRILPGQIEQVVINLVLHAAAGDCTRITVATECVRRESEQDPVADEFVSIRVLDDGKPLAAAVREQLFEPFFDAGRGISGLGLATCYGIAAQAGGHARARVDDDGRNITEISLPRTSAELSPSSLGKPQLPIEHRACRILLAEDEDVLRVQVAELLRTAGHVVHAVVDGQAALEWFEQHPDDVDLVLSDVVMPRMTGVQLAAALDDRVPVLLMSGFMADAGEVMPDFDQRLTVLQKPVRPDLLLRSIQESVRPD